MVTVRVRVKVTAMGRVMGMGMVTVTVTVTVRVTVRVMVTAMGRVMGMGMVTVRGKVRDKVRVILTPTIRPPKKTYVLSMLNELKPISEHDPLVAHMKADLILLDYINDVDIREAYEEVLKFYGKDEFNENS